MTRAESAFAAVKVIEVESVLFGFAAAKAAATRGGEPPGGCVRLSPPHAAMASNAMARNGPAWLDPRPLRRGGHTDDAQMGFDHVGMPTLLSARLLLSRL